MWNNNNSDNNDNNDNNDNLKNQRVDFIFDLSVNSSIANMFKAWKFLALHQVDIEQTTPKHQCE